MTKPCIECQTPTTMTHHVVPRSLGGTATVPLCPSCHEKAHGDRQGTVFRPDLIKIGLEKRRASGLKLGAPVKVSEDMAREIRELRSKGMSYKAIARRVGLSVGICHRYANGE